MEANSYKLITSATTTEVKAGPSVLQYVILGAGTNTVSILDDTTGTTATIATLTANATITTYVPLKVAISKAIRVVTSGTSAVTIVYRTA